MGFLLIFIDGLSDESVRECPTVRLVSVFGNIAQLAIFVAHLEVVLCAQHFEVLLSGYTVIHLVVES